MNATAAHHGDAETPRKLLREELTEQIIGAAIEVNFQVPVLRDGIVRKVL